MSLSCHNGIFSNPAAKFDRTYLEIPDKFSDSIGFLLCGIADDPFCPFEKGSSTSKTSVLWRCLIWIEILSIHVAIKANETKNDPNMYKQGYSEGQKSVQNNYNERNFDPSNSSANQNSNSSSQSAQGSASGTWGDDTVDDDF